MTGNVMHPIQQQLLHNTASVSDETLAAFAARLMMLAKEIRSLAETIRVFDPMSEPADAFVEAAEHLVIFADQIESIDPAAFRAISVQMFRESMHVVNGETPPSLLQLDAPSSETMWKLLGQTASELANAVRTQRDRNALLRAQAIALRELRRMVATGPQGLRVVEE